MLVYYMVYEKVWPVKNQEGLFYLLVYDINH